jgi:hypothetical protein
MQFSGMKNGPLLALQCRDREKDDGDGFANRTMHRDAE